jgi:ubiquitin-activating enzyme E1
LQTGLTRDDALVQVFGNELARKIQGANVFVVGAGIIGNEVLKTLGLMGVATRDQGKIYVMDNGTVNVNHLATHSLCRMENIEVRLNP